MNLVMKYELGQKVWKILLSPYREKFTCPVCDGTGRAELAKADEKVGCPRCRTRGSIWTEKAGHYFDLRELTIGEAQARSGFEEERRYMCVETGVGSGSVYKEADLYPTEAEAEAAARSGGAIRRAEIPEGVPV